MLKYQENSTYNQLNISDKFILNQKLHLEEEEERKIQLKAKRGKMDMFCIRLVSMQEYLTVEVKRQFL
jgi:hypothetical protein